MNEATTPSAKPTKIDCEWCGAALTGPEFHWNCLARGQRHATTEIARIAATLLANHFNRQDHDYPGVLTVTQESQDPLVDKAVKVASDIYMAAAEQAESLCSVWSFAGPEDDDGEPAATT
jgi:hypothetical protein